MKSTNLETMQTRTAHVSILNPVQSGRLVITVQSGCLVITVQSGRLVITVQSGRLVITVYSTVCTVIGMKSLYILTDCFGWFDGGLTPL